MSSSLRDIDLEEIRTYDPAPMTHDCIPTTMDAPQVETSPLAANNNPLANKLVWNLQLMKIRKHI
jgi:hypothetical protein